MKSKRNNSIKLAVIIILLSALHNIGLAQNFKPIKGNTLVKLNGFSVKSPSGDDWEYEIKSYKKNTVIFTKESNDFWTGDINSTYITAYRDTILILTGKSEKENAADYLNTELEIMKKECKRSSEDIEIDNVRMFDTIITGKKYYAMAYNTTLTISFLNKYYTDNLLFVYFPENTSNLFFGFLISSGYNQPLIFETNSSDLAPIYKIIKTFNLEETTKQ